MQLQEVTQKLNETLLETAAVRYQHWRDMGCGDVMPPNQFSVDMPAAGKGLMQ